MVAMKSLSKLLYTNFQYFQYISVIDRQLIWVFIDKVFVIIAIYYECNIIASAGARNCFDPLKKASGIEVHVLLYSRDLCVSSFTLPLCESQTQPVLGRKTA